MATTLDYVEFVCEQIRGPWQVHYKKMFGEYMVYVNEKPLLLICDNAVFVKKLEQLKELMSNAKIGTPYKGSKEHYILDIEDNELSELVINILENITPTRTK